MGRRAPTNTFATEEEWEAVGEGDAAVELDEKAYVRSLRHHARVAQREHAETEEFKKERARLAAIELVFGNKHRTHEQIMADNELERLLSTQFMAGKALGSSHFRGAGTHDDPECHICNAGVELETRNELDTPMGRWCPALRVITGGQGYDRQISAAWAERYRRGLITEREEGGDEPPRRERRGGSSPQRQSRGARRDGQRSPRSSKPSTVAATNPHRHPDATRWSKRSRSMSATAGVATTGKKAFMRR